MAKNWEQYRKQIIGMGESSAQKSYYPQLQKTIAELERSRDSFQAILNNANDSIFLYNVEGKILLMNERACQSFHIPEEEKHSLNITDISSPKNNIKLLGTYWNHVMDGNPVECEWIACRLDSDEEFEVEITLNQTQWFGTTCMVAIIRDISERKRYEEMLLKAKLKAEESDRLKSAFLANMSHEIRTPMNAILGFSELLQNNEVSEMLKKRYLGIIQENGNRLLTIINDLINISVIEANQLAVHYEQVLIQDLLEKQLNLLIPAAEKKGLSLLLDIDPACLELAIFTDRSHFNQVLTNLLDNALKFTFEGSITLGCRTLKAKGLLFFVKDTGVGIPDNLTQKIFDRFHKIDKLKNAVIEGTGLGLSISKAFVEKLGGKMWVESEPEKGSTFYFTHPK